MLINKSTKAIRQMLKKQAACSAAANEASRSGSFYTLAEKSCLSRDDIWLS